MALAWANLVQAENHTNSDKTLSVERLWQLQRLGSPVVSPDGNHVVAPVTGYDVSEDKGHTQLWLFNRKGGPAKALTAKGMAASQPVFSPDSKTLAFVSKRDDDTAGQVYLLSMTTPGEASRLTSVPTGVKGIKWVGEHLYFISSIWPEMNWQEMAEKIKAEKTKHLSARQWNALPYSSFDHWIDESRQAHIFRIPAVGGDVEAVTQPLGMQLPRSSQSARSYDVSANEKYVAFNANGWDNQVDAKIDVFLAKIGSEKARNITPDNQAADSS
ncbi:MAG: PD40 domain-containing protein, partial [Gammaproteobacteria bacterium]|nr:PD40 domain-containing protein [Gammaproteobacteria bacterium]